MKQAQTMGRQRMADAAMVRWTVGGAERGEPEKYSAKPAVGASSGTPGAATQNQYSTRPALAY